MGLSRPRPGTWAAIVALGLLIAVSVHPLCNFFFDCGCRPMGLGAAAHCNVHEAHSPSCPWCTDDVLRLAWVGALILGGAAAGLFTGRRRSAMAQLGYGVVGYLAGASVASLLAALLSGYPTWLGLSL